MITNKIVNTSEARRAWHVTRVRETIKTQGYLVGKREGKIFHERKRRMGNDTIKSNLQKIWRRGVVWICDLNIWKSVARFWIQILNYSI